MHKKGWAHRDIKPHNVLLLADGTPILMDLGSVTTARVQLHTRQDCLVSNLEVLIVACNTDLRLPPES